MRTKGTFSLDPERKHQRIGYDYLADEAGAKFETIKPGRGYHPPPIDAHPGYQMALESWP